MLPDLRFDNTFVRELPADPVEANRPRNVVGACYTPVMPTVVGRPRLVAVSREVAALVGLDARACESEDFAAVFAGNRLAARMAPYAACYGGAAGSHHLEERGRRRAWCRPVDADEGGEAGGLCHGPS